MFGPGEFAAVHDRAAHGRAVAADEFRQRMHDDIGAVTDGLQQDGRGNRVVHDQRHAVAMGDFGQRFDVGDIAGRIADAFAIDGARILVDQLSTSAALSLAAKRTSTPCLRNTCSNRVTSRHRAAAAVTMLVPPPRYWRSRNGSPPCPSRRTARRAALQRCHALLQHGGRRIAEAAIDVAGDFEVEQRRAVVRAVEFVSNGLVDRNRDGFRRGIRIDSRHGSKWSRRAWSCTARRAKPESGLLLSKITPYRVSRELITTCL